jgi:hypothetical protein
MEEELNNEVVVSEEETATNETDSIGEVNEAVTE